MPVTNAVELRLIRTDLIAILARLDNLIEPASPPAAAEAAARYCTTAIEWVLEQAGHPMSPVDIWKALQELGRTDRKDTVQVTTYDLWRRERIAKVDRGLYAAKGAAA